MRYRQNALLRMRRWPANSQIFGMQEPNLYENMLKTEGFLLVKGPVHHLLTILRLLLFQENAESQPERPNC
jgi:hypothetical protein